MRFRFTIMWKNELRITIDTLKYGEATSYEEYANLAFVPANIQRNNTSAFKTTKLAKKAILLANDVISLLVPGEKVIKVTKHQIEEYETKRSGLVINVNRLKIELNLSDDYLKENYQELNCRIYLPHVGYVDLLKLNLCKISSDLYMSVDIMILLIKMMDKEAQELGKSSRDRYYAR